MTIGVLGGCGPAAGAHFYTRLVALTRAESDAAHPNVLLCGRASTPDRTAYLLFGGQSPLPALVQDARYLEAGGADFLVLLCHTAHALLSDIQAAVSIPVLDMVGLSVAYAAGCGFSSLGVLCTAGTYGAALYEKAAEAFGIQVMYPGEETRADLQACIYRYLKQGRSDGGAAVRTACAELGGLGCPAVVLGCTELSLPAAHPPAKLYYRQMTPFALLPQQLIDPVEILARQAILLSGGQVKEEEKDATRRASCRIANRSYAHAGHGAGDKFSYL